MRSESLRRRGIVVSSSTVMSPTLEPLGLSKSEEPVPLEEPFGTLRRYDKLPTKGSEDESTKDSAIASSFDDDLCLMSDSNDGSHTLKDQIIHEMMHEDEESKVLRVKLSPEVGSILKETHNGVIPSNMNKRFGEKSDIEVKQKKAPGMIVFSGKNKLEVPDLNQGDLRFKTVESNAKITHGNNKQWISSKMAASHSRTTNGNMIIARESYADVIKIEKEENHIEQNDKKAKPLRKISFSLDN